MGNVVELLRKRLSLIENDTLEKSDELKFLDSFFDKYSISNPKMLFKANAHEICKAYFISTNDNLSYFEISDKVDILKKSFNLDNNSLKKIEAAQKFLLITREIGYSDRIYEMLNNDDKLYEYRDDFVTKMATCIYDGYEGEELKKKLEISRIGFIDLIHEYNDFLTAWLELSDMQLNTTFLKYLVDFNKFKSVYELVKLQTNYGDVDENIINSGINSGKITGLLSPISNRYEELNKQYKKEIMEHNKIKCAYQRLIEKLESMEDKEEISNVNELLDIASNLDINIETSLLKRIARHNKSYYDKLAGEYEEIKSKSGIRHIDVFSKYGMNFQLLTKEDQNKLLQISYIEIDKKLEKLEKLGIDYKGNLVEILLKSTINMLSGLETYTNNGILNKEFLNNNIELCYDQDLYFLLSSNLNLLNGRINLFNLGNTPELLLVDTKVISDNLSVLDNYVIKIINKGIKDYSFLKDDNLVSKIDLIIELGLEKILLNDPSIMNYSYNSFRRLLVVKEVGMEYIINGDVDRVLLENAFIKDNEFECYYLNMVPIYLNKNNELSDIKVSLEDYEKTNLSYDFNGVIISKKKVIRNFDMIQDENYNERLFKSIIKGSYLTDDELDKIKEIFSNVKLKK